MPSEQLDSASENGLGSQAATLVGGGGPTPVIPASSANSTPPPNSSAHGTIVDGYTPPVCNPLTPANKFRFLDAAVEPDEIGRLGNYRVLSLLGTGGMAFVFLA